MNNRREFLVGSAAALAAPWLGDRAAAATTGPGFHLGCVTHTLFEKSSLETIITTLEECGYEGVELRTTVGSPAGQVHGVEPSLTQAERAKVRKRFERSKVKLVNLGSPAEFQSPDAAERKRNVAVAKQFVDLAHDLGATGIKVRPYGWGTEPDHKKTIQRIGECLKELGEYSAPKGVDNLLEIHNEGHKEDKQMLTLGGTKGVGIIWNCDDHDVVNGSVKPTFDMLRPWFRTAHVKYRKDYPFRELYTLLHESKFTGYTMYEGPADGDIATFLKKFKADWTKLTTF
jgi:hypothetical protein